MRTIIAGSRTVTDIKELLTALSYLDWHITEIISGAAKGADHLGEQYAIDNDLYITRFPAQWDHYGKKAGYIRNIEMAKYADNCLVLWDGQSKGSKHMIKTAQEHKLTTAVWRVDEQKIYI